MNFLPIITILALIVQTKAGENVRVERSLFRLPENFQPVHYDLLIQPNLELGTFTSRVAIHVKVNPPASSNRRSLKYALGLISNKRNQQIVLNLKSDHLGIVPETIRFSDSDGESIKVKRLDYDSSHETVTVTLAKGLADRSTGVLHLDVVGKINRESTSLIVDSFTIDDNVFSLLTTQFQSIEARELFPCFDEPKFRATFNLTVTDRPDKIVLSNAPVASVILDKRYPTERTTEFYRTPAMPVNNLAFVIGKFDYVERMTADGRVRVRVYTPPGRANDGNIALDIACKGLEKLEEFYGIRYGLDKLDLVSTPNFNLNAKGYPGLIITRNSLLLLDENSSIKDLQKAKVSIIGAIGEYWIGNVVSIGWWNDKWLLEGINRWVANHIANELYPEDSIDLIWMITSMQEARNTETDIVLRPAVTNSTADKVSPFDATRHEKSLSLMGMISDWIGKPKFINAIQDLVESNADGTIDLEKFEMSVAKFSDQPIGRVLPSWLENAGHPAYEVYWVFETKKLLIVQYGFSRVTETSKEPLWATSLKIRVSDGAGQEYEEDKIFFKRRGGIKLPEWFDPEKPGHYVTINPEGRGFFHVRYYYSLLQRLGEAANNGKLSVLDKVDMLSTSKSLVDQREASRKELDLLYELLGEDTDPIVVEKLVESAVTPDMKSTARRAQIGLFEKFGLSEPEDMSLAGLSAYANVVLDLVKTGHQPAIDAAMQAYADDASKLPRSHRSSILLAMARHGDQVVLRRLVELALSSSSLVERDQVIEALKLVDSDQRTQTVLEILENDESESRGKRKVIYNLRYA